MPSYIRLLTEQPAHIGIPPTGHTALYASSGTGTESKYELYIKNPEGFSHPVGLFASGGTVSGHSVFNSGVTVYSGGFTTSGSPFCALAINGTLSGVTDTGGNTAGGGVIIQDNLTVSGGSDGSGGALSGVTTIAIGSGHTQDGRSVGTFASVFGKGNDITGLASFGVGLTNVGSGSASFAAGGSGNTASGDYSLAAGSANTASGVMSVGFGATNTSSGKLSASFGYGNSSTADATFAIGSGTTAKNNLAFAAGSATTASGTSHFVVGRGNMTSDLFVVGNGTGDEGSGFASLNNALTVKQSGVTIQSSGRTATGQVGREGFAALTVYSGVGHQAMGFMLPLIEEKFIYSGGSDGSSNHVHTFDPRFSADTTMRKQNSGLMFWDGKNIRVWTGGTKWATVTLSGDTRG